MAIRKYEKLDERITERLLDGGFLLHGSSKPLDEEVTATTPPYGSTNKYGKLMRRKPQIIASAELQIPLAHATLMGLPGKRWQRGTITRYAGGDNSEVVVMHYLQRYSRGPLDQLFDEEGHMVAEQAALVDDCWGELAFLDPAGAVLSQNEPLCYEYPEGRARAVAIAKVSLAALVEHALPGGIRNMERRQAEAIMPPPLAPQQPHSLKPEVISFTEWQAQAPGTPEAT